jgi:D-psicose/D-tagatose/L-ribulose 3-epimerase
MKFGVSLWLWTSPITNEIIAKYAPKIASMGFDTIEVPIEDPVGLNTKEARKIIEDNGLSVTTCAAMGPGRDLVHPDQTVRETGMDYVRRSLDVAHELGSDVFAGPIYAEVGRLWKAEENQRENETKLLITQLMKLSEYAEEKEVVLCVEALNRFETSFLNLTSQVVEVVDQVDHPNCKILVDLFHAGIEEKNLGDAIRVAGDRLYHVQVAENDRGTPGTGQFAWKEIPKALQDVNYDRHIIIETFTPDNEILAKAASIWRPLAGSPDELAREGLSFLKNLFK